MQLPNTAAEFRSVRQANGAFQTVLKPDTQLLLNISDGLPALMPILTAKLRNWSEEPHLTSKQFGTDNRLTLNFYAVRPDADNVSVYEESPRSISIWLNKAIGLTYGEEPVVRYIKKAVYHELIHDAQWPKMSAEEKDFYGKTREFYLLHPVEIMAHAGADIDELSRDGFSQEQILRRLAADETDRTGLSYFCLPPGQVTSQETNLYLSYARQYAEFLPG